MKASPLKKRDRDRLHDLLRSLHERLTTEFQGLSEEVAGSGDVREAHRGDPGPTELFEQVDLTLLQRDDRSLQEIVAALTRLDEGTYGTCEECEAPIARRRLEALPWARTCHTCQEERERASAGGTGAEGTE